MKSYNSGTSEDDRNEVQPSPKHHPAEEDTDNAIDDGEDSPRTCRECRCQYTIDQFWRSSPNYFEPPYDYRRGCKDYCLKCWLGVGPKDFPAAT